MQRAEVKERETKIPAPPVELSSLDHAAILYQMEHRITLRELQDLAEIRKTIVSSASPTEVNVKAVLAFFNNRWERVQRTNLCYPQAPELEATKECLALATQCAPYIKQFIHNLCFTLTEGLVGTEIKSIDELNDVTKFEDAKAQQKAIATCLMHAKSYIPTLVDLEDLINLRVHPFSLLMPTVNFRERGDVTSVTAVTGTDLDKLRLQDIIISQDNKTFIEVKTSLSTKFVGDILSMADTQCDLLRVDTIPTKDNLRKIKLSSAQAYQAYVRCESKLYYINKLTNECTLFAINLADRQLLDKELRPSEESRTINDAELRLITRIAKHEHETMRLSHTQLFDKEDKNCRLLTEEESSRMINHSFQAKHLHTAATTFITFRKRANTSLGHALEKLVKGLKKGGMSGGNGGRYDDAGADASIAIHEFEELLELMDEDQKKYLFRLTAPADISSDRNTFEKIWINLHPKDDFKKKYQRDPTLEDLKGYAQREGQCVEENAGPLVKIIEKADRDTLLAIPIKFKKVGTTAEHKDKKASPLASHSYYADLVKAKEIFDKCYDDAKCKVTATYGVGNSAERTLTDRIKKHVDIKNIEELYTFLKFLGWREQHDFLKNFSEKEMKNIVKTPAQVKEVMDIFLEDQDKVIFKTIFESDETWIINSITTINELLRVIELTSQSPLAIIKQLGAERLRAIIMQKPATLKPLSELMNLLSAEDCKAVMAMISSEQLFELYKAFTIEHKSKFTRLDLRKPASAFDLEKLNFIKMLSGKAIDTYNDFLYCILKLSPESSDLRCLLAESVVTSAMIELLAPTQAEEKEAKSLPDNIFNLYTNVLLNVSKEMIKDIFNSYGKGRSYVKLCTVLMQQIQESDMSLLAKSEKLAAILASKLFKDADTEEVKPIFAALDIKWFKPLFSKEAWSAAKDKEEYFNGLYRLLRSLHKHDHDKFLALISEIPIHSLVVLLEQPDHYVYIPTCTILKAIPKDKRYDVLKILMEVSLDKCDRIFGKDEHELIKKEYLSQFTIEQRMEYLCDLYPNDLTKYYLIDFEDLQQIPQHKLLSLIKTEDILCHIVELIQPKEKAIQFLLELLDNRIFNNLISNGDKLKDFVASWRPEQQKEFRGKFTPEQYEKFFVKTVADLNDYTRSMECKEKEGCYRKYLLNDSWRREYLESDIYALLAMGPHLHLLNEEMLRALLCSHQSIINLDDRFVAKIIEHLVNTNATESALKVCLEQLGIIDLLEQYAPFKIDRLINIFTMLQSDAVKQLLAIIKRSRVNAIQYLSADYKFFTTTFNKLPEADRYAFISQFTIDYFKKCMRTADDLFSIVIKLPINQRYGFLRDFNDTYLQMRLQKEDSYKFIRSLDEKDQLSFWKLIKCTYKYKVNDMPDLLKQFDNVDDRLSVLESFGLCVKDTTIYSHQLAILRDQQNQFFATPHGVSPCLLAEQCHQFLQEIAAYVDMYGSSERKLLAEASIRSLRVLFFPTDQANLIAYEKLLNKLPGHSRPIMAAGTALIGLACIAAAIIAAPTLLCTTAAAIICTLSLYAARKLYVQSGVAKTAVRFFDSVKATKLEEKIILNTDHYIALFPKQTSTLN